MRTGSTGSGHRWVADADRRDRILAPVADALLAAAHITTGDGVVDIGCGCGATALAAARAVGPAGAVRGAVHYPAGTGPGRAALDAMSAEHLA